MTINYLEIIQESIRKPWMIKILKRTQALGNQLRLLRASMGIMSVAVAVALQLHKRLQFQPLFL